MRETSRTKAVVRPHSETPRLLVLLKGDLHGSNNEMCCASKTFRAAVKSHSFRIKCSPVLVLRKLYASTMSLFIPRVLGR